jgi:signal peptidase I
MREVSSILQYYILASEGKYLAGWMTVKDDLHHYCFIWILFELNKVNPYQECSKTIYCIMSDQHPKSSLKEKIISFWRSAAQIPSAVREIASVLITVGIIVAILLLLCGTWPAIVTIESESMVPHMNVGDLVLVVAPDRYGNLQSMEEGNSTEYEKYGMPGDVIIYRPNGNTELHPIIHRAIEWVEAGEKIQVSAGTKTGIYTASHEGYITKGDNNPVIDQIGWTDYRGTGGPIQPVKKEWIIGKAMYSVPIIGYLPLNIIPVIIIVVIIMIIHELYIRSKDETKDKKDKIHSKKRKV